MGGVLSEILRALTPSGPIQTFFLQSVPLAVDPPLTVDFVLIKLTLGFLFKINLFTIFGIFFGIYLYKNL